MKKRIIFLLGFVFVTVCLVANIGERSIDNLVTDGIVNLVKVKFQMPDSSEVVAVIPEGENLEITLGDDLFIFSPKITDLELKSVIMENINFASNKDEDDFQFEIIDIVSSPMSEIQPRCTCCITCNGGQTCASCVFSCGRKCCCYPACCVILE